MNLYLALRYCIKLVVRRIKIIFHKIPSNPFNALLQLNLLYNSDAPPPPVLYLGDSVIERVANQDKDKRTLGKIVSDELSSHLPTGVISFSAYHMSIYCGLLSTLDATKHQPKIIILPINIRSFSPQWDFQPRWQYEEEQSVLKKYRQSGTRVIGRIYRDQYLVPEYLQYKFRNTRVDYPMSDLNTIGQFLDVISCESEDEKERINRKQQIFIFNYGHPLSKKHRKIFKLTEILNLLLDWKLKVVTYLTPINFDAGVRYVGPEFREQILKNVQVINDVILPYQKNGNLRYFDWCTSFPSKMFFYDDLATEHLNQEGRLHLAKKISHEVCVLNETGKQ